MGYPDTTLGSDQLDPEFGGQPADEFGLPAWQWLNAVVRFLSRMFLAYLRVAYTTVVVPVATSVRAGDFVVVVAGAPSTGGAFTAQHYVTGLATPMQLGIALEPQSVGVNTRIATAGIIPPTITGLGTQLVPADAGLDASAGRVRIAQVGDLVLGKIDLGGNLLLTGYGQPAP